MADSVDIARLRTRIVRLPGAWKDVDRVTVTNASSTTVHAQPPWVPSPLLLQSEHHVGVMDLGDPWTGLGGSVRAMPPQPHRRLTAAALLLGSVSGGDTTEAGQLGEPLVVAAGDSSGVVTVTRTHSSSNSTNLNASATTTAGMDSSGDSVATVFVGPAWEATTRRLSIEAVIPSDTTGGYLVCHRHCNSSSSSGAAIGAGEGTVWVCSVEGAVAWQVPLPGPVGDDATIGGDGTLRLFDLSRSSSSVSSALLGAAGTSHISLHNAATLELAAAFPFPPTAASRRWTAEGLAAIGGGSGHLYCAALRSGGGDASSLWSACYDARSPGVPWWLGRVSPGNATSTAATAAAGVVKREESQVRPAREATMSTTTAPQRRRPASFLESFDTRDGSAAACVLDTAVAGAAALATFRASASGVSAHSLAFPGSHAAALADARAIVFAGGVLSVIVGSE